MEPGYAYNSSQPTPTILKRGLLVFVALVLLAIGGYLVVRYLTTGVVVVDSASNARITVSKVSDQVVVASASGSLNARLKAGKYTLLVSENSFASSQVIVVAARQTATYTIKPRPAVAIEPVSDSTARNIIAGPNQLYFINPDGHLAEIDSANNQSVVSSVSFKQVVWADSSFGVGQDINNKLYSIINGSVSPLQFNISGLNYDELFAVAPDHTIYVSSGKVIYRGSVNSSFSKFYTASETPTNLSASGVNLLLTFNADKKVSSAVAQSHMVLVGGNGQYVNSNISSYINALSPDGKYIVVSGSNGGELLDNSLNEVSALPNPNMTSAVWLDKNTLAYGLGSQLWTYNLHTKKAQLLANMPFGGNIRELSVSDDASYIYMAVTHLGSSTVIKRVGLKDQGVSANIIKLQNIMPYSGSDYFMNLINFTSPTVIVEPLPPLANTNGQYVQEAQAQLQQNGINISGLRFVFVPPAYH